MIVNKTREYFVWDKIDSDEIEDIKIQLIENSEQIYKLYSENHKLIDNLDTFEKDVASSQGFRKRFTKSKAKIDRYLKWNVSNKIKINSSIRFYIRLEVSKNNFHVRLN